MTTLMRICAQQRALVALLAVVLWVGNPRVDAQAPRDVAPLSRDEETALYRRVLGHFDREALPPGSRFIPDRAVCGTSVLVELASKWNRLSKSTREAFAYLFQRPDIRYQLDRVVISPGGHFKIHYTTIGTHAVSTDDTDRNGVPDYVDEVAGTFDHVWDVEINQLGYNPPPSDGDPFYDIYIRNLASESAYGYTYPETPVTTSTSSYMEIDNNYTDTIYRTRGLDGLHVTAAHEFYHAVQFGYYADFDAAWWQEVTAVWMEDVVYDDINDYYQYVSAFFNAPEKSLDSFSFADLHVFGAAVYAHHMARVYGKKSIRRVWEALGAKGPSHYRLEEIDAGMPAGGFAGVMPRFVLWNYLTGNRARVGYYPEGSAYPTVKATTVTAGYTAQSGSGRVDHLGAAYIRVPSSGLSGGLQATFSFAQGADWKLVVLLVSSGNVEVLVPAGSRVEIPNAPQLSEVVFVPVVVSLSGLGFTYTYTISLNAGVRKPSHLVGDFDVNGTVNFADFIAFVGGYGKAPDAEGYSPRLDVNGDGPIDFRDFLIFASHYGETTG